MPLWLQSESGSRGSEPVDSRLVQWVSSTPRFLATLLALSICIAILVILIARQFEDRPVADGEQSVSRPRATKSDDQAHTYSEPSATGGDNNKHLPSQEEIPQTGEDDRVAEQESQDSIVAKNQGHMPQGKSSSAASSQADSSENSAAAAANLDLPPGNHDIEEDKDGPAEEHPRFLHGIAAVLRSAVAPVARRLPVTQKPLPSIWVDMHAKANESGDQLRVSGDSSLPENTRLRLQVFPTKTVWLGMHPELRHTVMVTIQEDGSYEAVVNGDMKFKSCEYLMQLSSRGLDQPASLTLQLTQLGEAKSAPFVRDGEGGNYVFAELRKAIRPALEHDNLGHEKRLIRRYKKEVLDAEQNLRNMIRQGVFRAPWSRKKEMTDQWNTSFKQIKAGLAEDISSIVAIEKFEVMCGALQGIYNTANITAPQKGGGRHWYEIHNKRILEAQDVFIVHVKQMQAYLDDL